MIEDKNQKKTALSELGEFGLIEHLTSNFSANNSSTILGIGDDAAVLDFKDKSVVVSTDLLVEGVHFDLSYMPLKHLGYKAVVVNLSDIYAMNAQATQITVSIAVSNRFGLEALEALRNDTVERPFIVLLDLNMPRMNGMEFLSAIRSDPNLSDIVVFVLTTSQLDEEISAAYKKNIAGYIVKSSSNQDYKQLIRFLENYWNIVELPKC